LNFDAQQVSVKTVTAYDVETKRWTVLPDLPEARDHVGGAVIDDIFYVVGGRVNGVLNARNTTYALDLSCLSQGANWVEKAQMPTARGGLATSHVDGVIYAFGGEGDATLLPNGVYNETEAYDTRSDTWIKYPVMSFPRHGMNAVAVGRCNHIPGGGWVTQSGAVSSTNDAFCV